MKKELKIVCGSCHKKVKNYKLEELIFNSVEAEGVCPYCGKIIRMFQGDNNEKVYRDIRREQLLEEIRPLLLKFGDQPIRIKNSPCSRVVEIVDDYEDLFLMGIDFKSLNVKVDIYYNVFEDKFHLICSYLVFGRAAVYHQTDCFYDNKDYLHIEILNLVRKVYFATSIASSGEIAVGVWHIDESLITAHKMVLIVKTTLSKMDNLYFLNASLWSTSDTKVAVSVGKFNKSNEMETIGYIYVKCDSSFGPRVLVSFEDKIDKCMADNSELTEYLNSIDHQKE